MIAGMKNQIFPFTVIGFLALISSVFAVGCKYNMSLNSLY